MIFLHLIEKSYMNSHRNNNLIAFSILILLLAPLFMGLLPISETVSELYYPRISAFSVRIPRPYLVEENPEALAEFIQRTTPPVTPTSFEVAEVKADLEESAAKLRNSVS